MASSLSQKVKYELLIGLEVLPRFQRVVRVGTLQVLHHSLGVPTEASPLCGKLLHCICLTACQQAEIVALDVLFPFEPRSLSNVREIPHVLIMVGCKLVHEQSSLWRKDLPCLLVPKNHQGRPLRCRLPTCRASATVVSSPVKQGSGFTVQGTSRKQNEDRYTLDVGTKSSCVSAP